MKALARRQQPLADFLRDRCANVLVVWRIPAA
jgi:hypothetical protein